MDVFGEALYQYWRGDRKTPFYLRRDDGYVEPASLKFFFARQPYPMEKGIISHAQGRILDVGCGAGRHVLYFQRKGMEITGIDVSEKAIIVCRARGCHEVRVMDIFQSEIAPGSYDTVLLFGRGIGIGGTLKGVKSMLERVYEIARPHGVLLVDSVDVTKTDLPAHLEYHKKSLEAGKYVGEVTIQVLYKGMAGPWFPWVHVQADILEMLAQETGWIVENIHQDNEVTYSMALRKT